MNQVSPSEIFLAEFISALGGLASFIPRFMGVEKLIEQILHDDLYNSMRTIVGIGSYAGPLEEIFALQHRIMFIL